MASSKIGNINFQNESEQIQEIAANNDHQRNLNDSNNIPNNTNSDSLIMIANNGNSGNFCSNLNYFTATDSLTLAQRHHRYPTASALHSNYLSSANQNNPYIHYNSYLMNTAAGSSFAVIGDHERSSNNSFGTMPSWSANQHYSENLFYQHSTSPYSSQLPVYNSSNSGYPNQNNFSYSLDQNQLYQRISENRELKIIKKENLPVNNDNYFPNTNYADDKSNITLNLEENSNEKRNEKKSSVLNKLTKKFKSTSKHQVKVDESLVKIEIDDEMENEQSMNKNNNRSNSIDNDNNFSNNESLITNRNCRQQNQVFNQQLSSNYDSGDNISLNFSQIIPCCFDVTSTSNTTTPVASTSSSTRSQYQQNY